LECIASIYSRQFAAVIIEPVQGVAGWQTVPVVWIKKLEEACRETDTFLIMDEIQCGLGRCGHLFHTDALGVRPDFVLLGKALAGGAYPLGAVVINKSVMRGLPFGEFDGNAGIGSTFSNNALGCAIASDVYHYLKRERLHEKARGLGALFTSMAKDKMKHRELVDVRAVGLGVAIDFSGTKAASQFVRAAIEQKVLTYAAGSRRNMVKLSPPLVIEKNDIFEIVDRLAKVLEDC